MIFTYTGDDGDYVLSYGSRDRSLRPRDAADEYLLEEVSALDFNAAGIINDKAGALSVPLGATLSFLMNDSYGESRDCRNNLKRNDRPLPPEIDTLSAWPAPADLLLMKIPKSLDYFRFQLERLRSELTRRTNAPVLLLAAGMNRALPLSFFECFSEYTDEPAYSRIVKKARIYRGLLTPSEKVSGSLEDFLSGRFDYGGRSFNTYPGVFAHGKLDAGSRLLLEWLTKQGKDRLEAPALIADPGCGSGVLGLTALALWPSARLIGADDHALAVGSSRANAQQQGKADNCDFRQTNILESFDSHQADLVLCNPPFHRGRSLSLETGFAFIRESSRLLKPGGRFLMVANTTLGYGNVLKENFKKIDKQREQGKYSLFLCTK